MYFDNVGDNFEMLVTDMRYSSTFSGIITLKLSPTFFNNITILIFCRQIHRCWWRLLMKKYVGDQFLILMTKSASCRQHLSSNKGAMNSYPKIVTNMFNSSPWILEQFLTLRHTRIAKLKILIFFLKNVKSTKIILLEFYLVIMEGNRKIFAFVIKQ